jgi:cell division septation protein DedD
MDSENVKVKERVELSLDGRQIASIVVGALVLLGVIFVLGLNLGRQLAARQFEATRGDALAALDRPPPMPAGSVTDDALTYHDRLTRERPPPPEEPPVKAAPASLAQPMGAPVPAASAASVAPAVAPGPPGGAFAVQLVSTPSRAEADKLAGKLLEFDPRVEPAEVNGKGHVYRVRVGSFETRAEAEKLLKTLATRTGGKGMVVPVRPK